jgi:hypothetical protein
MSAVDPDTFTTTSNRDIDISTDLTLENTFKIKSSDSLESTPDLYITTLYSYPDFH